MRTHQKGGAKENGTNSLVSELRKLHLKMWVGPESQIRFWPNSLPHGQLHASSWTTEISQIIFFWQIYSSVLFFDDTTSKGWTFLSDLTANSRIFILEYCEEISHMKKKQFYCSIRDVFSSPPLQCTGSSVINDSSSKAPQNLKTKNLFVFLFVFEDEVTKKQTKHLRISPRAILTRLAPRTQLRLPCRTTTYT